MTSLVMTSQVFVGYCTADESAARKYVSPTRFIMTTPPEQPRSPLHGITVERMLNELFKFFGWQQLGQRIRIRCFTSAPSIASSLKFLRKTPWARRCVEQYGLISKIFMTSRTAYLST
jgi:hypothetical protein